MRETAPAVRLREAPAPFDGVAGAATPPETPRPPAGFCAGARAVSPDGDLLAVLDALQPGDVLTLTPELIAALRAGLRLPWEARVGRLARRDAAIRDLARLLPPDGVTLTAHAVAAELARAASVKPAADRPGDPVRAAARRVLALQPGGLEWRQLTRILAGHRS